MGTPGRLTLPALTLCLLAAGPLSAHAQISAPVPQHVTEVARTTTGQITGRVVAEI